MKKILMLCVLLFLGGCSSTQEESKLQVVTSFFPYYSMTESLIDDSVSLDNIMPLGMEVHDYEPTPKDIALLERADLFIVHGMNLESWLDGVLNSLTNKNLKVLIVSERIKNNETDPHTWLNPVNGYQQFTMIKDSLVEIDPSNEEDYQLKYNQLSKDYQELIDKTEKLSSYSGSSVIVDHLAYSYLLEPFGLVQESVMRGIHSDEASAMQIEAVINTIKSQKIKEIYVSSDQDSGVNRILVEETGVAIKRLYSIETKIENESYLSLMNKNVDTLLEGLK